MSHKGFSFPVSPLVVAVVVGFLLATTTAMPVAAQSARLEGLVNNVTYEATPATTYKNGSFTLVGGSVRFYTLFDEIVAPVESATFYYYISSSSASQDVELKSVSPYYDPDTLTWITQPSAGATIASHNISGTGWKSLDVTSYINANLNEPLAMFLLATAGSGNVVLSLPATDHIYIEYVSAPLDPPPLPPLHCFNFDTNLDAAGTADFALASGATVGTYAGVLDAGLAITGTGQLAATFPPMATAANVGFSISGWWQMNDAFDIYELVSTDTDYRFLIEGDTQTAVAAPFGNVAWNNDTGEAGQWNYMGGGIASDGSAHVMVNTNYYTDSISSPTATAANIELYLPDTGRTDQLMIFPYALSRENHLWLWNGGRGRSCYELVEPTAVGSIPVYPTPQYYVDLPSGGRADVYMQATGGELLIAAALILLLATIVAMILHYMAHRSAAE